MTQVWPKKQEREDWEVVQLLKHYALLPERESLKVKSKHERPVFLVCGANSRELYRVELTSVYVSDISVLEHKNNRDSLQPMPYDENRIHEYKKQIATTIVKKNAKAKGYGRKDIPLILSVYLNEYCRIYMDSKEEWMKWAQSNRDDLSRLDEVKEIVLWPLCCGYALGIRVDPFDIQWSSSPA